ncbi:ABC-F family ATP-binding cassette domain-containing protein [Bacillus sp. FJAT-50079]|uniref:ABC-F family ATP-binding cassette domain-containing protein n=1 Tax=Bacillus sp. FJAT-50079 TaxID=2833577 RepID=UPI001BC8F176|nr:ABC-F family ATP-binding cassette domain-containing protein [Bacillus sp. FJAT-50079]MBS4209829.1 ABC-F family ATP-binding cassette domain-containing protein [Bacillus sp. FJAT-50079]
MKIFSAENLSKTYGDKRVFNDITFHIQEKERIGLIGVNGTGKSSLLKIIAGIDDLDSGRMTHPKDYSIGYLPQEPLLDETLTILEQVFQSDAPSIKLMREHEEALIQLTSDPENEALQQKLFQLQKQMDDTNGWEASTNAKTILSKLGFDDISAKVKHLSGGQKKRVALAQILIETPDLLLLDEPTNHLDYETIQWLQTYLSKYHYAVMIITHDRYFLDQIATRVFELDNGNLYSYTGNYEAFIEAKSLREEQELQAEDKRRNLYRRELAWIKRGAKARSTKQKARIQRFDALSSELGHVPAKENLDLAMQGTRLGKQVFEFIEANKSFENRKILHDFNWLVKPGDRYGIVGKNGSGKSTLLNLLAGKLRIDSGEFHTGQTVNIAYYTQETDMTDENTRMIAYIREAGELIETADGDKISASQMLERFLFPMSTHGTPIKKLSGGEKRRLFLLKLLMEKPNVLLLDEPTNDLDTTTLTVLENYIEEFPGVVISVSHDRYFLDKTAEQLLVFQDEGNIERYYGTYSEYLESTVEAEKASQTSQPKREEPVKPSSEQEKKKRMTYKEKMEWETIEDDIAELEEKVEQLNTELLSIGSDFEKAQRLMEEIEKNNEKLEQRIARWTYLSEFVE